jgi:RNA polymerase sigma factor for flagellar operon FliA
MQAGGQVAEARTVLDRRTTMLIEEQLPLVKHIVFQVAVHFPRHVDRDDLARAGALGLIEAARRWDEDRGVPFDRFAARRIKGPPLGAGGGSSTGAGRAAPDRRARPDAVVR